ncbi:HAD family hydrolase [Rhodococcus sp. BP-349]|uniref:HAD family hydrolase n=1 Tax=unclassified Rhodococcus (in: high G+C Gram-positive bacteria) TaxID=192944 RepID=UPI001C9A52AD|nr:MULTISPECIES: HAD family hydrolase [unclassified Rhodococcus (in: high G+C Gram-positive bacteria)]MBY6537054.1 HAD family hydrolase [Rhodococcus sp. BP-363]MBY6541391.1 HAD family hydrolase [Rhodococcus sp. BP-369]MBY6560621.1 HAD family hydrolase [Rhodococcus sp. BP-370]MBY6574913.1 HAD family hydrolase [Rhodococcus sp. BP-364]MBY6584214.1 HAD family hydrolase [Rhodococcus sp. BP-358]
MQPTQRPVSPGDTGRPRLVASDVDGTLIDHHERVTARTKAAVHAVMAAGDTFVLSTGRPPRWIGPIVDQLGHAPMAVCANGAVIYDSENDVVVSARTLSVTDLAELAALAESLIAGCGLAVERVGRSAHDAATPQFVSSPGYEHAWLNPDNTETSSEEVLSAPAVKLLIRQSSMTSGDMAAALTSHVEHLADVTFSTDNGLIELSPPGVSKASGLLEIARTLGIEASEMIAFGDMPNDVPMLTMVGHGVAMGNAHPAAIAAADEVTTSNADDGVARVLERWWS